ncbi:MAG: group II intron reverse transcriptase/maturase [Gammaproteobacteria bacterium]
MVETLMQRVLEKGNLQRALRQVMRNKGSAGVDRMSVSALPGYLKRHWLSIKDDLLAGRYRPQGVLRVEIPKADGGIRSLGIPTVVDRFIQQALMQVLQSDWDGTFSASSYGFRPGRSAHQALRAVQGHVQAGCSWVVDLDLEKFFDRVNHDVLLSRVRARVRDTRVVKLIAAYLKAPVDVGAEQVSRTQGTPQGGPLSPLLSNLLLDDLDRELARRGHRFVRYADDCNIYVRSRRAGERVKASVTRFLERKLRLQVNERKSAVDRPWRRQFLGFTFGQGWSCRLVISAASLARMKERVRALTRRTRGRTMRHIVQELREVLLGWRAYYGISEVRKPLREMDKWVRRKLRCYAWKQWGRGGYRQLRHHGVSRELAWNTCKSAHGPWRLSRSPALSFALPAKYFAGLGLPELAVAASR